MTLDDFIKKYDGKTKGYPDDSQYLGECLSLVKLYLKECFGFNLPPSGSNSAYGYWENFPYPLENYFVKVENSPLGVPDQGDVIIWNTKVGGGFGHIAIYLKGDVNGFTSFDQNWIGKAAHEQTHSYSNVVGWLHPKEIMNDTIAVDRATFEKLVTNSTRYDELVKVGITQAADVEELRRILKEAQAATGTAQQEARDSRQALADYQQQVASKLNSPQDIARVLSAIQGLMDSEAQAVKNSIRDGEKLRENERVITDLKAEIARLQLELKGKNSLSTATMLEMLTELFNRIKRILNTL